jgi:hypothetical protein
VTTRGTRRIALGAALLGSLALTPAAPAAPRLPDLDQLVPTQVSVTPAAGGRYQLGFDSRIANGPRNGRGVGPMIVRGRRSSTSAPMIAEQVIHNRDGSSTVRRRIGQLHYETAPDHSHWHYKGLDHYEVLRASDRKLVRPAYKAGFCMPDRLFTPDHCGSGRPAALTVQEGLSPGFVDLYQAYLEGQSIDVTGVKPGVYNLVHRVNADSSLCESNLSNNAAAAKIRLWPNGYGVAPYVSVLENIELFPLRKLPPAPADCPLDRRAPRLRVRIPRAQQVERSRVVVADVRCNERCSVAASARLRAAGRTCDVGTAAKAGARRQWVRIRIRVKGRAAKAVRRAARRRQLVAIRVTLRARDAVGNPSRKTSVSTMLRP